MSLFAIADLHLGICTNKPMDIFGEHWKNHDQKIKLDWNNKVKDTDSVLILGDHSWGLNLKESYKDLEWINNLKGRKILVKGNHDYFWTSRKKLEDNFKELNFLQNNHFLVENRGIIGTRGWSILKEEDKKIFERELMRLKFSMESLKKDSDFDNIESVICVSHFPFFDCSKKTKFVDLVDEWNIKETKKITNVFFGHIHNYFSDVFQGVYNGVEYRLVSCDYTDFKLVKVFD